MCERVRHQVTYWSQTGEADDGFDCRGICFDRVTRYEGRMELLGVDWECLTRVCDVHRRVTSDECHS